MVCSVSAVAMPNTGRSLGITLSCSKRIALTGSMTRSVLAEHGEDGVVGTVGLRVAEEPGAIDDELFCARRLAKLVEGLGEEVVQRHGLFIILLTQQCRA